MHETAFRSEKQFTQEEFWRWLEERPASDINHYELLGGRIVMTPPAGWPHGGLDARLSFLLTAHVDERRLGVVQGSSAGYDLPSGDTLEPDVSFISRERFAAGPKPTTGRFLRIVPSLVVEILSPSTALRDRMEKREVYARNGVDEYWIVDPRTRTVTVFRLGASGYDEGTIFARGRISSAVLPDLSISVEEVFSVGEFSS